MVRSYFSMVVDVIVAILLNNVMLFFTFFNLMVNTMELQTQEISKIKEEMGSMALASVFLSHWLLGSLEGAGRDFWVFPRQSTFNEVIETRSWQFNSIVRDSKWLEFYRMDYASFERLVDLISPYLIVPNRKVREPLSVRTALKIVLYRLGDGMSPRRMRDLFQVGKSTIEKYTDIICEILSNSSKLLRVFIQIPRGKELQRVIDEFEELCGLPNCCGAVDGSYIRLKYRPGKMYDTTAYRNRKQFSSLLLQGMCDANKMFMDVCCLFPGGVHDSTQFTKSSLYRKLKYKIECNLPILKLPCDNFQEHNRSVREIDIRPYVLGDRAYSSRDFCVKIFNKPTNALMTEFDRHIKQRRIVIENAFGILKGKFQILDNLRCQKIEKTSRIIIACCVLHNFCRMMKLGLPLNDPRPLEDVPPHMFEWDDRKLTREGQVVRSAIFQKWMAERISE